MPANAAGRYLVLSDMHFGTPESKINDASCRDALVAHMVAQAPWKEIVLTGDLLDVNLATFKRAIEGGKFEDLKDPLFGFRELLTALDRRMRDRSGTGLAALAEAWVYTPGNHDYKVWDMLSTHVAFEEVLKSGSSLSSYPSPLQSYRWSGLASFFGGLFQPFGVHDRVAVEYPDHVVEFSIAGGREVEKARMVLTHGHYLDKSQTLWSDLNARLGPELEPEALAEAIRDVFIKTAQYQALANAVSYTLSTRQLVSGAVGPGGWGSRLEKFLHWLRGLPLRLLFGAEKRRGEPLSADQLERIETYLTRFRGYGEVPRWFVFGHTHRQAQGQTPNLRVQAYNAGSCYPEGDKMITFAEIEVGATGAPEVRLRWVDGNGEVK
jgi:UDP-2,3-diacylglucosamine pyrophosphatase LpxH